MRKVTAYTALLAAVCLVASCSSGSATRSSAPGSSQTPTAPQSSSSSQPSAANGTFISKTYGYTLRPPAQWTAVQASGKWDGHSGVDIDASQTDKFHSPTVDPAFWAVATPWQKGLTAFTSYAISWTASFHGDTCPTEPSTRTPITIDGQPGVLLAYDCGILINHAITVDHGVGYWFVFRDGGVQAATDPADHATFMRVLKSVQFSG